MLVLDGRVSLTPYREEGGLVLAMAGVVAGVVGSAGAGWHPTGTPDGKAVN